MEEDKVKNLLDNSITDVFVRMKDFEPESDEFGNLVKRLESMYKLRISEEEIDVKYQELSNNYEKDIEERQAQAASDLKKSKFDVLKMIAQTGATSLWLTTLLLFETNHTFTRNKSFGILQRFLTTKA